MGNPEHMEIARQGTDGWNEWRAANLRVQPDLTRIDLSGRDLRGIDFRGVGLFKANLARADLRNANLRQSILIKTNFEQADLTGAYVYGVSVWDVNLNESIQKDLIITEPQKSIITVDNLEMAQFIHLILINRKIREIIDTITSKVVLILGQFLESKPILDEIKAMMREQNLLPVLFDFSGPASRDFTETVSTLAHLARFIIVDITLPRAVPQELYAIIPHLQIPIAPIIKEGEIPYIMFSDFQKYPWVFDITEYSNIDDLRSRTIPEVLKKVEAFSYQRLI